MMRRVTVSMCLLALIGCAGKAPPADSAGGPAKHPPAVPPMVATPIDEMLRAQAKEELTTEVKSSDELLRAHALEEMKQQRLPEAESIIVAALADRSSLVRKAAALAAGELQVQGATDRLSQALDTAAPNDRIALIFALHRLGDTSHSHELERTAVDPDARLRGDTALVLGMLGDKSSVPIL